ncbi:MAG: YbaB/EbfC family nucleoid-associated protein [Chloroflexi bacterium]|nr:YbaB/EbfC family nucleoid-associated protein [Chloroflexota bacterium]
MGPGGAGVGGGGPMAQMQQIQQLQAQLTEAQAAIEQSTVSATAGGGAVTVTMTGGRELVGIAIKPEVVDPEEVEMLQDLILAAYKEALAKVQQMTEEKMSPLTSGLGIPGLF